MRIPAPEADLYFNPLPPHGGRPVLDFLRRAIQEISIHSLRMEGDTHCVSIVLTGGHFNPLPPHGGRRNCSRNATSSLRFQSTPSAWRETTYNGDDYAGIAISIHSLRMEGDHLSNP